MNNFTDTTLLVVCTLVIVPLTGLMMAIVPYLMKKSECFAVTVPEVARTDPYLGSLKRRYVVIMVILTALFSLIGLVTCLIRSEYGILAILIAGPLVLCLMSFVLMLYFRQKVRLYKKERNWVAQQQTAVASFDLGEAPKALSLKWNLLYIPVLLITVLVGVVGYAQMPDVITVHVGFGGEANGWMDKSPMVILIPLVIQVFLAACMILSHWMIIHSKRAANPEAPATSALAYGMFARANSAFLLAIGLGICLLMIPLLLAFMGVMNLIQVTAAILIFTLILIVGAIAIAVVYGQGGSRVFARMQESSTLLADNDQFWKLGVFYFNPDDPSLFLLERFGVGWTFNWARPAVWAILAGGAVLTIAFVVVVIMLV